MATRTTLKKSDRDQILLQYYQDGTVPEGFYIHISPTTGKTQVRRVKQKETIDDKIMKFEMKIEELKLQKKVEEARRQHEEAQRQEPSPSTTTQPQPTRHVKGRVLPAPIEELESSPSDEEPESSPAPIEEDN